MQAYVACGGNEDKTGHVDRKTITRIIKEDFGLDIDIDKLMDQVDTDGSGEMEYDEFELLLSGKNLDWNHHCKKLKTLQVDRSLCAEFTNETVHEII